MDHEYLGADYVDTLQNVNVVVDRVLRQEMKEGGLKIKYFSWTKINFNKGKYGHMIQDFLLFIKQYTYNSLD